MTDAKILELASKYLQLQPIHGDESVWDEWCGKQEELLKFARCLLDYGFSEGHKDGYTEGVNDEQMYPENAWSEL